MNIYDPARASDVGAIAVLVKNGLNRVRMGLSDKEYPPLTWGDLYVVKIDGRRAAGGNSAICVIRYIEEAFTWRSSLFLRDMDDDEKREVLFLACVEKIARDADERPTKATRSMALKSRDTGQWTSTAP